jgi:hypothetical protein
MVVVVFVVFVVVIVIDRLARVLACELRLESEEQSMQQRCNNGLSKVDSTRLIKNLLSVWGIAGRAREKLVQVG